VANLSLSIPCLEYLSRAQKGKVFEMQVLQTLQFLPCQWRVWVNDGMLRQYMRVLSGHSKGLILVLGVIFWN